MGSAKIIITLWVRWKKPIEPLIEVDPEDLEDAQDIGANAVYKGRPVSLVNQSPQEMDEFEKEEMKKSRPEVKNQLREWSGWPVDHVPKPIKNAASTKFLRLKNSILKLYYGVKYALKGEVKNQKQAAESTDLTAHKNEGDNYIRV